MCLGFAATAAIRGGLRGVALGTGGKCHTGCCACPLTGGAGCKAVRGLGSSPSQIDVTPQLPSHSPFYSHRLCTPENREHAFYIPESSVSCPEPNTGFRTYMGWKNQVIGWGRGQDVYSSLTSRWFPSCLSVWGKYRDPHLESSLGLALGSISGSGSLNGLMLSLP